MGHVQLCAGMTLASKDHGTYTEDPWKIMETNDYIQENTGQAKTDRPKTIKNNQKTMIFIVLAVF